MKLTLQLQLLPNDEQAALLLAGMKQFNAAASFAAKVGFKARRFSQPSIHGLCYYELRERFGLTAQMAVRAIGKVVECFQRDKTRCPVFKPQGAMTYDHRILKFQGVDKVNLMTLSGRRIIPIVYGEYQAERFDRIKGQSDLIYRDGKFYLLCTIEVPENAPIEVKEFLGVDLGIINLATTSDGERMTGDGIERVRQKHHNTRRSLQRKTGLGRKRSTRRNARRALRNFGQKESRFRRHTNHVISKRLVAISKGTGRGIALENLKGIRGRTRFKKRQRARMGGWAFLQLRLFVEYKAKLAGVIVVAVDPRNTSRTCSTCGHCEKSNRKSQAEFECQSCGYMAHADLNAAENIAAAGAVVNQREESKQHRQNLVA